MNNAPFVPEGIPPMRVEVAAKVLGYPKATVTNWTRSSQLRSTQAHPGAHRYITAADLARFAHRLGIKSLYWEQAL